MSRRTAGSGSRRALGGLAAGFGLMLAMAMPALASHDTDLELVEPSGQTEECAGFDFGWKLDNIDQLTAGTYTASDANHTVFIEIELIGSPEINDFEILDADPDIDSIFVKQPQEGGGISHLTFCYDEGDEPTPTPTPSPTPSESELGGTPTPSPTPRESELGGNPTPTPELPDTATSDLGAQMPSIVLSLVLVGSLATLMYVRLAGQRD